METFIFKSEANKEVVVVNADSVQDAINMLNVDLKMRSVLIKDDYVYVSSIRGKCLSSVTFLDI